MDDLPRGPDVDIGVRLVKIVPGLMLLFEEGSIPNVSYKKEQGQNNVVCVMF